MENLSKRLVSKSIEAFIMGIKIYNKPTIKYRVEGFSFFICNAWELMLKAHLINQNGEDSIYYSDSPNRTITLESTIKKIFTNANDPLRINLERIIELRNTSTHFITEDYERIYAPLFQSCVMNFINEMEEFHNEDITKHIAQNFLTLSIRPEELSNDEIKGKYSTHMAEKLIHERDKIAKDVQESNSTFAIPIQTTLAITKNQKKADILVSVVGDSGNDVKIVKEIKDPNSIYINTTSTVVKQVNRRLRASNILLTKIKGGELTKQHFTSHDFQLFVHFYKLKSNPRYCYYYKLGNRYGYSTQLVDFLVEEIKKDPEHIVQNLKAKLK
ncbi:DUF3644 domain-containing protein [Lactiplantibacillus plantarum]|uniref:DUF3644 domain-containing protein n=1 Tax=Lactiplantibacillus plantarum TaxID=1590 RepID=UPI00264C303A|nr:DUF3644 domain-containing protein [Lactiplantibacillus plantarum]MDN7033292.1 DUF3644 domain-containing protein [Lactiplantibacillus plantarum]